MNNARGYKPERRIHVLFVSDHLGYANNRVHGATTYFLNVLPRLEPDRIALTVCFLRGWHAKARELEAAGVQPIFLDRRKSDPRVLWDLVKLVQSHRIEVLHLAGMKGCLLGRMAAAHTGRRAIIHLHDTTPLAPWLGVMQRRVARWTDLALGCSAAVCELARHDFGIPASRVRTLHYGIDLKRVADASPDSRGRLRREWGMQTDTPGAALIGRFHPMKGHEQIVRAWPSVLSRCPAAKLVLVGDGPTRSAVERQVDELNLRASIRFTGHRDDMPDILMAADVMVMPSLFGEGLPYAAIEAIATGKPVVAYPVAGIPEVVVDGRTGLLAPLGDESALAHAVIRLFTDQDLARRLGHNAREHAGHFDIAEHVKQLEDIYADVVGRHHQQSAAAEAGDHTLARVQPQGKVDL